MSVESIQRQIRRITRQIENAASYGEFARLSAKRRELLVMLECLGIEGD